MSFSKITNITGSDSDVSYLKEFNTKCSAATCNDKRKFDLSLEQYNKLWTSLLQVLPKVPLENICTYLDTIRILSRDKAAICGVIEEKNLEILLRMAGLDSDDVKSKSPDADLHEQVRIASCQCLSNVIYQSPKAQDVCCTAQYLSRLLLHVQHTHQHLLTVALLRLIFLITALRPQLRRDAVERDNGLRAMLPLLEHHGSANGADSNPPQPTMQKECVERVVEVLKVLYNLCVDLTTPCDVGGGTQLSTVVVDSSIRPEDERTLNTIVPRIRDLLLSTAHTHQHTQLMHSHCINLLVCVPTTSLPSLTPASSAGSWWGTGQQRRRLSVHKDTDMTAIVQILAFLHARLNAVEAQSSEKLTPVLTMLVSACQSNRCMRQFVRQRVMPPLKDVSHRPEEGNSLRSRLVKLMTSPVWELKHLSATLLFILCNQSVERLIKYSGYGNCAGLLASLGLLAGGRAEGEQHSDSEDSDTEEYDKVKHMVNPVTGCYEPVRPNPLDNMTEEQREYEAIKLVNALDKLIRTGDIKPCTIGPGGQPQPLQSVLQLQDQPLNPSLQAQQHEDSDSE